MVKHSKETVLSETRGERVSYRWGNRVKKLSYQKQEGKESAIAGET